MAEEPTPLTTAFAFAAQSPAGTAISGTINATSPEAAAELLRGLDLRIIELRAAPASTPAAPGEAPTAGEPSTAAPPPGLRAARGRALRGADFLAFNQQLARLTAAGLPMENGLRLIAEDLGASSPRTARTVQAVADDLESGVPLGEAFERHHARFPGLYGRLVEAGVRANNLPAVLLNLGRHIELLQRLQMTLWRSASYPAMVLVVLLGVLAFMSYAVMPQFEMMFRDFHTDLPGITMIVIAVAHAAGPLLLAGLIAIAAIVVLGALVRLAGWQAIVRDAVGIRLPLIGPVLRRNLVARWCDALRLGVDAGLDLPAAIALAGDVVSSPALSRDGRQMTEALAAGRPLDTVAGSPAAPRYRLLPATVPAAVQLAGDQQSLSQTLDSLSRLFQDQAEIRMTTLPLVLTPIFLLVGGLAIGFTIIGLFAPMISLIQAVSGPGGK